MKKNNRIYKSDITTIGLLLREDPSGLRASKALYKIQGKVGYSAWMVDELWRQAEIWAYPNQDKKWRLRLYS